jgi:hypothetical protein
MEPSKKSAYDKLQVKAGRKFLLINAPVGMQERMGKWPEGATPLNNDSADLADIVQVFVHSQDELNTKLPAAKEKMCDTGMIWITYPKGTGKLKSDIHRDTIRDFVLGFDLKAVSLISIDDDWSALRVQIPKSK